jgi:hypothetical protein
MVNWSKSGKFMHLVGFTMKKYGRQVTNEQTEPTISLIFITTFSTATTRNATQRFGNLIRSFSSWPGEGNSVPYAVWCRVLHRDVLNKYKGQVSLNFQKCNYTSYHWCGSICCHITDKYYDIFTILTCDFSKEQYVLPEDDLRIETCRSILSVLM